MKTPAYVKFMAETAARRQQILKLRDKGVKLEAIALQFGITRQRVHQILNPKAKT